MLTDDGGSECLVSVDDMTSYLSDRQSSANTLVSSKASRLASKGINFILDNVFGMLDKPSVNWLFVQLTGLF